MLYSPYDGVHSLEAYIKMTVANGILLGKGEHQVFLDPRFANRHGLIAGATGTGKTVSTSDAQQSIQWSL